MENSIALDMLFFLDLNSTCV